MIIVVKESTEESKHLKHTAVGRKFLPTEEKYFANRGICCRRPWCRRSMCGSARVPLSGHRTVRTTQRWTESVCQARDAAVGRKFLPSEGRMAAQALLIPCHGCFPAGPARKTKQGADFPPQEAGNAAPGPFTPPFRGVLRGRGESFKIIGFSRTGRGVLHHTFLNLY